MRKNIKKSKYKLLKNRRRGKEAEKRVADFFDGERKGILGKIDVETNDFAIEVKTRKRLTLTNYYEQAEKYSKGKIPLLVLLEKNSHLENAFLIIKLKYWREFQKFALKTTKAKEKRDGI